MPMPFQPKQFADFVALSQELFQKDLFLLVESLCACRFHLRRYLLLLFLYKSRYFQSSIRFSLILLVAQALVALLLVKAIVLMPVFVHLLWKCFASFHHWTVR